ncbi:MAG TPA: sortase, partial [Beutenbergiaceae bacterium]|nr:sortase [Beutenbergiaceae bacterium]
MAISIRTVAVAVLFLIASGAAVYPQAAQWVEQYHQSKANDLLSASIAEVEPGEREELRAKADEYNQSLLRTGPVTGNPEYFEQMRLADTDVIGRLRVPSIDLDQPIRHTVDEYALLSGVGHAEGTSMPVGGLATHAVLGGHRGLAEAVGFTHLPNIEVGDMVYVDS